MIKNHSRYELIFEEQNFENIFFFVFAFQNQTKILLTISDMILSEKMGQI